VIVPQSAVVAQDGRDVVFVVQSGRAERRAVTVAAARGGDVTLTAGVAAGERVVATPPAGLADGAAIVEKQP
jgi:HlyD family secretion protein